MAVAQVDWRPAFLAVLARVPIIDRACQVVGIGRATVYRARKADNTFAQAWDEALEAGVDAAEVEVFRRAVDGFDEPVVEDGRLVYRLTLQVDPDGTEHWNVVLDAQGHPIPLTVRRYSDNLLVLIMKGRRRKLYANRTEVTAAGAVPLDQPNELHRMVRMEQLLAVGQARQG